LPHTLKQVFECEEQAVSEKYDGKEMDQENGVVFG
jgi:hypothetical protein